jgi:hypothetical protein
MFPMTFMMLELTHAHQSGEGLLNQAGKSCLLFSPVELPVTLFFEAQVDVH